MPLNPLNHHYAMENPASVYDEEAMTALELAGRTTAKVNETVRAFNELETQTHKHLETQDNRITKMNDETMPAKVVTEFQKNLDNGTFEGMVDTYAGELEARVDNLLANVPEGGTTMDAEVIDLRTGPTGRVYQNAGTAVREGMKKLAPTDFLFPKEKNLYKGGCIEYPYNPYDGVQLYQQASFDITLDAGGYYIYVPKTNFISCVVSYPDTSRALDEHLTGEGDVFSFNISERGNMTVSFNVSRDVPNTAGNYFMEDLYLFKMQDAPIIHESLVRGYSLLNNKHTAPNFVIGQEYFDYNYTGSLYATPKIFTFNLEPGDYKLIVGDTNAAGLMISSVDNRYVDTRNQEKHSFAFTVTEEMSKEELYVTLVIATSTPMPTGTYYAKDVYIFKNVELIPSYLLDGTELDKKVNILKGTNAITPAKTTGNTMATGESIWLNRFPAFIKQNVCTAFSGKFDSFSNIEFGFGNAPVYGAFWVKVDGSNVYINTHGTATNTTTVPHGLNIKRFISCVLTSKGNKMDLVVNTSGGTFKHELGNVSPCGTVFAKVGQDTTNATLSASCKDFNAPLWMVGDSYFGITDERVIGQLQNMGYSNYLVLGQPGINSANAYNDLEKALNFGTPKTLVWYVGLNDQGNIPAYETPFNKVKNICSEKNIELILNKVPAIPASEQGPVQEFIKNTGYRYIDSNGAVGASSAGWDSGLLSADGAHPTAKGAQVLATQLIIDVPEILSEGVN